MTRTVWRISAMRGPRTVAIVAGCAVSAIRLARSDQLNLGLGFRAPRASLRLRAIGRAEFRASVRQVARDGVLTQAETLGDLTICQSSPGELQYLDFPFAAAGPPPTLGPRRARLSRSSSRRARRARSSSARVVPSV